MTAFFIFPQDDAFLFFRKTGLFHFSAYQ